MDLDVSGPVATGSSGTVGSAWLVTRDFDSVFHPQEPRFGLYVLFREREGNPPGIYVSDIDHRVNVLEYHIPPPWRCVQDARTAPREEWFQLHYVDGRPLPVQVYFDPDGHVYASWLPVTSAPGAAIRLT
jgi:hypothetical protein